jgi:tetratricopeptide (TPR) repeat protein
MRRALADLPAWAKVSISAAVIGLAIGAVVVLNGPPRDTGDVTPFPPPPPTAAAPVFEDFAGAATCRECHGQQHDAWTGSTHGRAGGAASSVELLKPFDGRPIRFSDADVVPTRRADRFMFIVRRHDGRTDTLAVDGVVGGGHMLGGGTQGFVTRWNDGTLRLLPFELAKIEDVWFCNTGTRLDGGWLPITPDMRVADCGDWPPVRALGEMTRLATCQQCHGSQIDIDASPGRPRATRLASLAIDCESCHGPGSAHIAAARDGANGVALRMRSLATLDEHASNTVCFACHALKDALQSGYMAGADLETFYSLLLPLLSDAPVHADGRIRTFAYQQGHLWSDCYLAGTMTCTDCHEPHGQTYRDVNGRTLASPFDDGQCTACHASKAVDIESHTMHPAASEGSRCVSCHMPYLQEPEVGSALRYARSDHTIPVPRPASDAALEGIELACAQCHAGVDAETLDAQVRARWGELKPRRPQVQALLDAGARPTRSQLVAILENDPRDHDAATFMALGTLLRDHIAADRELDASLRRRLESLAAEDQPDIAAAALATLHYAEGGERRVRRLLVERLAAMEGERAAGVHRRWLVLLGFLGDRAREAGRHDDAVLAYHKALELDAGDAGVLANLGLAHAGAGRTADAIAAYHRSLAADSSRGLTWVNLGVALSVRGDPAGAEAAYTAALRADPQEPIAAFNLGNLFLRSGRNADAAAAYRLALDADPGLADAWFNLARALVALDALGDAAHAIRAGLEFEPDNNDARAFLEELVRAAG